MSLPEYPPARVNRSPLTGGTFKGNPFRGVLHTTESDTFTPAPSTYFGHKSFPHFTITHQGPKVEIYQHITIAKAARALRNSPGGVQTNRANAIQIEIVGRARNAASFSDPLLVELARWMRWVEEKTGVRRVAPFAFRGPAAFGINGAARMTRAQWNSFNGWCGHQHVPENDHWDPGLIPIERLLGIGEDGIGVPGEPPVGTAEQRYMVNNVSPDDHLNCRGGAGVANDIVGTFASGQKDIEATGSSPVLVGSSPWREVKLGETRRGWVNERFLCRYWVEDAGTFPVRVAPGDRLNVRFGPGTGNAVLLTLEAGTPVAATGLVAMIGAGRWREIATTSGPAWVNAHFLGPAIAGPAPTPEEPPADAAIAQDWSQVPSATRRRIAMDLLTSTYGYAKEAAAGVVGNLMKESGVMPNRLEGSRAGTPLRSPDFDGNPRTWTPEQVRDRNRATRQGPRAPGVGLAQWTSEPRRSNLFTHPFQGQVLDAGILFRFDAQMAYLVNELHSAPYDKRVNSVLTRPGVSMEDASDEFVYRFEVPAAVLGPDRRLAPRDSPSVQREFQERRSLARTALGEFERAHQ
jgi:hypothetical protein